jgi:hypothetical protein
MMRVKMVVRIQPEKGIVHPRQRVNDSLFGVNFFCSVGEAKTFRDVPAAQEDTLTLSTISIS